MDKLLEKLAKLGEAFSPGTPVSKRQLFAGRSEQLKESVLCLAQRGQHMVIYGERGVGKTSLAQIMAGLAMNEGWLVPDALTINCARGASFTDIWQQAMRELRLAMQSPRIGFQAEPETRVTTAKQALAPVLDMEEIRPEDVRYALQRLPRSVVIFDEFDTLTDADVTSQFAHTIKTFSDHGVDSTIVLVGVADSVDQLIAEHASIERSLRQIRMPRMSFDELIDLLRRAYESAEMSIDSDAAQRIASMSCGLPHFTHTLGLQAGRVAVDRGHDKVTVDHVNEALAPVVKQTHQSLKRAYAEATQSNRPGTLFKQVLLACALAKTDDLGFFASKDVREPLSRIARKVYDIPAFSRHLNDFADNRGPVLHKRGAPRKYRFRFQNPLMQPFVVINGLNDGLIVPGDLTGTEWSHALA